MIRGVIGFGFLMVAGVACEQQPRETAVPVAVIASESLERLPVAVTFSEVREIVVAGTAIWVLDGAPPFVTRIAKGGQHEAVRFGRGGDGPAELRRPVALASTERGVQVWDVQLDKRVSYGFDGSLDQVGRLSHERSGWIRSDMDQVSHLDPWRIRRVGDSTMYVRLPRGMTHPIHYASGSLVRADENLGSAQIVLELSDLVPRDKRSLGHFPAMPLWDVCPTGFALWNPRSEQVEWRSPEGQIVDSVSVPSRGEAITIDGVERFLRRMARLELGVPLNTTDIDLRAEAERRRPQVGSLGPAFVDLRCGSDERVWLRRFDLRVDALGDGRDWLVVYPGGALEHIRLPSGFEPLAFERDLVLGVVQLPEGQVVHAWTMIDRRTQ